MALARTELGDEALLVNARPATPETRSLGAFEVVFGVLPVNATPLTGPRDGLQPFAGQCNNALNNDIAELKREMARLGACPSILQDRGNRSNKLGT